ARRPPGRRASPARQQRERTCAVVAWPALPFSEVSRVTLEELLAESREMLGRLGPERVAAALRDGATLIDMRSDSQVARDGVVPGALVIARNVLEWRLDPASDHRHPRAPGLDDHVILMCDEGYQSSLAAA